MRDRVFPLYEDSTLEDFEILSQEQKVAVEIVEEYLKELHEEPLSPQGLTFTGPTGVGKTHLACVVLKEAKAAGLRIECLTMSMYIQMNHDLFDAKMLIQAGWDDRAGEYLEQSRRLRAAQGRLKKSTQMLLLDDIGREHESGSGWSNEQLFDLLRNRYFRKLPTIFTTNWKLGGLQERYGEGFSSVLQQATQIVNLNAEDYRAPRGTGD